MRLPPITRGARLWSVIRLVGYGVAHAAVVFLLALLVRHGLHAMPGSKSPWLPALAILGRMGLAILSGGSGSCSLGLEPSRGTRLVAASSRLSGEARCLSLQP